MSSDVDGWVAWAAYGQLASKAFAISAARSTSRMQRIRTETDLRLSARADKRNIQVTLDSPPRARPRLTGPARDELFGVATYPEIYDSA